jgi:hypothetical protein
MQAKVIKGKSSCRTPTENQANFTLYLGFLRLRKKSNKERKYPNTEA